MGANSWFQTDNNDSDTDVIIDDSNEDYNDDPFEHMRHVLGDQEDTSNIQELGVEASPLLFRRYRTLATVESYFALGVPVSAVLTNRNGPQRIGVIVTTCNEWWLLPLRVGELQFDDEFGFTYFQIELYPDDEQVLVQSKFDGETSTYHVQLLNYVTLLPALWLQAPFPYALMTMEGNYLDAEYNFV